MNATVQLDIAILLSLTSVVTVIISTIMTQRRLTRTTTEISAERIMKTETHLNTLCTRMDDMTANVKTLELTSAKRDKHLEAIEQQIEELKDMKIGSRIAELTVEVKHMRSLLERGKGE